MKRPRRPVFLGRIPYRRRRLRDAARLLPVFGMVLLLLPLMWAPAPLGLRSVTGDLVYLFVLWPVLIAAAAAFAPGLSRDEGPWDGDED